MDDGGEISSLDHFRAAVIREAGLLGWRKLQAEAGGIEVYVPRVPRGSSFLSRVLGQELAEKICRQLWQYDANDRPTPFPRIRIPLGTMSLRERASAEVERLLQEGYSVRQAATTSGVSERTAWRLRKLLIENGRLSATRHQAEALKQGGVR